jgi:hypothetical protein
VEVVAGALAARAEKITRTVDMESVITWRQLRE